MISARRDELSEHFNITYRQQSFAQQCWLEYILFAQ